MTGQSGGEWADLRAGIVDTPELQQEYERIKRAVLRTRRLLQQIDAARERAGLTKADLAERIGADPSVVRRLFSSGTSNPTLKTVLEIAEVLGLEVDLQPSPTGRRASSRSTRRAAAA